MDLQPLLREIRLWRAYCLVLTAAVAVLVAAGFRGITTAKFDELNVERINVVEPDGKVKLVITNAARQPAPKAAGETVTRDAKTPGMLFYNQEGDEVGGLVFSGEKRGGKVNASASLTFDQYQQDQTLQLLYNDENDWRMVGMRIKDRPDIPISEHGRRLAAAAKLPEGPQRDQALAPLLAPDRVFIGKSGPNAALWLFDTSGKPRLKLGVGKDGEPRVQFLDAAGKVTYKLPPDAK